MANYHISHLPLTPPEGWVNIHIFTPLYTPAFVTNITSPTPLYWGPNCAWFSTLTSTCPYTFTTNWVACDVLSRSSDTITTRQTGYEFDRFLTFLT